MLKNEVEHPMNNSFPSPSPAVLTFNKDIIYTTKHLEIKIHHLSKYFILLTYLRGQPFMIEIKLLFSNYIDIPSQDMNKNTVIRNILTVKITKDNDVVQDNELLIDTISKFETKSHTSFLSMNSDTFDVFFMQLENAVDTILQTRKEIKELKQSTKSDLLPLINTITVDSNVLTTKNIYRKKLKELRNKKSSVEKFIVKNIIKLYI